MKLQNTPIDHVRALRLATAAALSISIISTNIAQTAKPEQTTKVESEEAIELSPFTVDASKDVGYRATSTMAGSRINTDLKDVAASIQVVTKEFLSDLSAVDVNDILSYIAGSEGTRDFTATTPTLGRASDGPSQNSSGSNRLRGLAAADITRDYFYTIGSSSGANGVTVAGTVGFDTYNLDQTTINRGPNSVLAGLGSPAGIINYSPQLAMLNKSANEVTFRFGSFGDQRATFNSNILVEKGKLAFRVAGVWMDKGFDQKPAWNRDKRLYATSTFKPWDKTTIRVGFEVVKVNSNIPNSVTPEDDITQWVALGKPSYDRTSADTPNALLFAEGNLPLIVYSKDGRRETSFNANTGYYFNQQNTANVGIWQPVRFSDNTYGQWNKINTMPSTSNQRLETHTISIDQEIVHDLYANVSFMHEDYTQDFLNLFRPEYANYLIDVDLKTASGATNPHYGETYMQFRGLDNKQTDHNTNSVGRATLTYKLDLEKFNKWLGKYSVTAFAEERRTETDHIQYTAKRTDIGSFFLAETGIRYYLGGSATTPATTVPVQPGLVDGLPNVDILSGAAVNNTLSNFYALKSDAKNLTKLSTSAIVLQGYLWGDRIVPMFGLRRDTDTVGDISSVEGGPDLFSTTGIHSGTNASTGLVYPISKDYGTLTSNSASTKTYGVVVHPLKWLSFHYNHSQNWIPNAGSIDLLGKPVSSPAGLSKDYGFAVNLMENKLNLKFNWYETTAKDGSAGNPANFPLAQWNMTYMDLVVEPELARLAGVTYKQGVAPGITVGDPRLANAYTADNSAKGIEIEMIYSVTKNWSVMANVSKQEAKQSNIASSLTAFINERLAYWQSIPALWTGQVTQNNSWGLTQTGQQHYNQFLLGSAVSYQSVDGQPSTQLAKWHANMVTKYTFDTGLLKGLSAGICARYIDKRVIGNPAIYSLVNGTNTVTGLDLDHPYYAPSYVGVDAWLGYKTRIYEDKYLVSFQLNCRDLQESGGYRAIAANSDGTRAVFRIIQPRTFYLTTKIEF